MLDATDEIIQEMKEKALILGWTIKQLQDFKNRLYLFMPCRVGLIKPYSICIELFHHDGSTRGAVTHYNKERSR